MKKKVGFCDCKNDKFYLVNYKKELAYQCTRCLKVHEYLDVED